jgi:60S ribosome subunit biogenesis protein NIP7
MRKATNVGRTELMSLGTCFGKFTKSRKFKLHVTCLDHIAQYAKVPTLVLPLPSCNGQVLLSACSPAYAHTRPARSCRAVQYKVWVKPAAEMSFLYGHNITKAGLGRITEDTPQYQGVVVYSMADVPLGMEPLRVAQPCSCSSCVSRTLRTLTCSFPLVLLLLLPPQALA